MWCLETIRNMNRERLTWQTGNWTSYPADGRCFLERSDGLWWAYQTGSDGRLLQGFPKLREEPFKSVEAAQAWAETHVPARTEEATV